MESINQITINNTTGPVNGQVEFQFIRNAYPLDDKLYCYFTVPVTGSCRPEVGDWIGIYKVGWTGLNEFTCKKMITLEECGLNQETGCGHVVFEFTHLPKNIEHFYQFVYIKNGELVRGASKPFTFEVTGMITGQPEKMIEYTRQQQEIRNQIERFEKEGQRTNWQSQSQLSLPQLITQLRQNEERIANIKQQFNELRTTCQMPVEKKQWIGQQPWTTGMPTGITGEYTMQPMTGEEYTMQPITGMRMMPTEYGMTMPINGQVYPTGEFTGMPTTMTYPTEEYTTPEQYLTTGINGQYKQQQPWTTTYSRQGMEELQQSLKNLKLGLQGLKQQEVYGKPSHYFQQQQPINREGVQLTNEWEHTVYQQVERKLVEQIKHAQVYRQKEQVMLQAQLKSCQRQLVQQERKQIKQTKYDELYIQQQVREFAHKLTTIRYNCELTEEQQKHQEYQVARFESLLRERLALECEKKQRVFQHIQQRLRECELKLREHQHTEQLFAGKHHQQLKGKLALFQQTLVRDFTTVEKRQTQMPAFLREFEINFVEQVRGEQELMRQTQQIVQRLVEEVTYEMNELECEQQEKEVYGPRYMPGKSTLYKPTYYTQGKSVFYKQQIAQLEQQIAQFKRQLKLKTVQQTFEQMGYPIVGQEWTKPIVQKLREVEACLKYELTNNMTVAEMPIRGVHVEKMLVKLMPIIAFLVETPFSEVAHFVEEHKVQQLVAFLRELECQLVNIQARIVPTFVQQYVPINGQQLPKRLVKELIAELQHIVAMRIKTIVAMDKYTGEEKLWSQVRSLEQQLFGMKQLDTTIEQHEFKQLLNELERKIREPITFTTGIVGEELVKMILRGQEQLFQQIRDIKHFWSQYKQLFARGHVQQQTEQMHHFKLLCKLVALVECQLIKFQTVMQQQQTPITGQHYPMILKKQLQLFKAIKQVKWIVPFEHQELVTILLKHKIATLAQDAERFLPVEGFEQLSYQPLHKTIKQLVKHVQFMECPEEKQWEVKEVLKHHGKQLRMLLQHVEQCLAFFRMHKQTTPVQQQQYHFWLKQQIKEIVKFVQYYTQVVIGEQQPEQYLTGLTCELTTLPKFEETTPFTYETVESLVYKFNVARTFVEQELIATELVQRFMQSCIVGKPESEIRRMFEQLYLEQTKLGQLLRTKLAQIVEIKGQFVEPELHSVKVYLDMKLNKQYNGQYFNGQYNGQFNGQYYPEQSGKYTTIEEPITSEEEYYYVRPATKNIVDELKYQLNKMRMEQPSFVNYTQLPKINNGEECYRSIEQGSLLVRLPQQQQQKMTIGSEYPITREETIYKLQKKINKLAGVQQQQPIIEFTQEQTVTICPVCDVYLGKQIAPVEYELHINGHFTQ